MTKKKAKVAKVAKVAAKVAMVAKVAKMKEVATSFAKPASIRVGKVQQRIVE